ncbi:MAG: DUF5674 family protein [Candidatus Omnitrophica bacterium]|nr:DUF5674 family protein [Candidatus Omnitrophota bacterium]
MKVAIIGSGDNRQIYRSQLKEISASFGNLVKAAVDIEKVIIAIGGELQADEEAVLLENGSQQRNLWGINLYPDLQGEEFIEFDSVINLRPAHGNRTRGIDDPRIRQKIKEIVDSLILS